MSGIDPVVQGQFKRLGKVDPAGIVAPVHIHAGCIGVDVVFLAADIAVIAGVVQLDTYTAHQGGDDGIVVDQDGQPAAQAQDFQRTLQEQVRGALVHAQGEVGVNQVDMGVGLQQHVGEAVGSIAAVDIHAADIDLVVVAAAGAADAQLELEGARFVPFQEEAFQQFLGVFRGDFSGIQVSSAGRAACTGQSARRNGNRRPRTGLFRRAGNGRTAAPPTSFRRGGQGPCGKCPPS